MHVVYNQYRLSKCLGRYNVCVSVERQRLQGAVSTKAYEHMGCSTVLIYYIGTKYLVTLYYVPMKR